MSRNKKLLRECNRCTLKVLAAAAAIRFAEPAHPWRADIAEALEHPGHGALNAERIRRMPTWALAPLRDAYARHGGGPDGIRPQMVEAELRRREAHAQETAT